MSQVGRAGASAGGLCSAALPCMTQWRHQLHTCSRQTSCPHICPPPPTPLPTERHQEEDAKRGERKQLPIQMGNLWQVSPWRWRLWAASCRWRSPHAPDLHSPVFTEQLRHRRRLQPAGEALSHHSTNTGFLQQEKQGMAMSGKA